MIKWMINLMGDLLDLTRDITKGKDDMDGGGGFDGIINGHSR